MIRLSIILSKALHLATLIGLIVLITHCRRTSEDLPILPPTKPGPLINLDTLSPKILSIYIPDLPDQNIKIDQEKETITIIIPPTWHESRKENVVIRLSPNATWARAAPVAIDFCYGKFVDDGPVMPGDMAPNKSIYDPQELTVKNGVLKKVYKLFVQPAGEMYFGSDSLYQVKSDEWRLPNFTLYNLFGGNDSSKTQAVFTHQTTGKQTIINLSLCPQIDGISVDLPPLALGKYSFQIRKSNGRVTTNALHFNLTQGKPQYYSLNYNLEDDPAKGIVIEGKSLYQTNNTYEIELWHNRTGVKYSLRPYKFSLVGTELVLPVPQGLQAGYYYSHLLVNGQPYGYEYTTVITKNSKQPMIYEFLTEGSGNLMSKHKIETISLKRNTQCGIQYSPYKRLPMQVRFSPLSGNGTDYILDVETPADYGSSPGIEVYPDFTIPADMKRGRYLMSLQYKTNDGVLQQGEPLERDIIIE